MSIDDPVGNKDGRNKLKNISNESLFFENAVVVHEPVHLSAHSGLTPLFSNAT